MGPKQSPLAAWEVASVASLLRNDGFSTAVQRLAERVDLSSGLCYNRSARITLNNANQFNSIPIPLYIVADALLVRILWPTRVLSRRLPINTTAPQYLLSLRSW